MKIYNIREAPNADKVKGNKEENLTVIESELTTSTLDKNAGHRERLRNRFEKSEFDGFNDYEVLEFMLSYAIPRKDTKVIAKNLLKRFGSIQGILSVDKKELEQIVGLGKLSVIFIKALPAFIKFYFQNKAEDNEIQFTELEQTAAYFKATIGSYKNEVVKVLYLNSQNEMIHSEILSEGTVNESYIPTSKIVETAVKYKTTSIIIAHNHPDGFPAPSESDNIITQKISEALKAIGIVLLDHIIISSEGFYSYRKQELINTYVINES